MREDWLISALVGAAAAALVAVWVHRRRIRSLNRVLAAREHDRAERARSELDAAKLQAQLDARRELAQTETRLEQEFERKSQSLTEAEHRIAQREAAVDRQLDRFGALEQDVRNRAESLEKSRQDLDAERQQLQLLVVQRRAALANLCGLDPAEARAQFLKAVEQESQKDAADLVRRIGDEAKTRAEEQARRVIATAIQRFAGKHTVETTTATVALTGDEMKGRIIGRDGRNIRAFEAVTGITVLVDDTPNAVVLSGFDPVRREIARQAMERLILDGRIHPTRIEEVVATVTQEMDAFVARSGEDAVARVGLTPVAPEVARTLGKLQFRHSFSQNIFHHSIEVAHLCGLIAAELGADVSLAKRSGLLHDIGKAMTHEIEGPHAIVGANFIKAHGEVPLIVNAVAAHHGEVPHESLYGIIVAAADAISASRPGSRSESTTTYLKRLENLEQIALEFDGVEKAFAVQAGRELRVVVRPEQVDDSASLLLARNLARRVEEELHYPGQIRVMVVRETRCVEYAK